MTRIYKNDDFSSDPQTVIDQISVGPAKATFAMRSTFFNDACLFKEKRIPHSHVLSVEGGLQIVAIDLPQLSRTFNALSADLKSERHRGTVNDKKLVQDALKIEEFAANL